MNTKKKYEIIVGIIVIIAIILVFIGKSMFSDKQKRREHYEITVEFSQVGGLETGSEVLVNGVRAGKITRIDLQNTCVCVRLELQNTVEIFANAEIAVREYGLMGTRRIEISQHFSQDKIDRNNPIQGIYMPGLHETISDINTTINNLNSLAKIFNTEKLNNITVIFARLATLLTNLNSAFSEKGQFTLSMKHFEQLCSAADSLIVKTDLELTEISEFSDSQLPQIEKLLNQMRKTFRSINRKDANFQRFTSSDSLYKKTYKTLDDLDSLMIDMKENPKRYFKLF